MTSKCYVGKYVGSGSRNSFYKVKGRKYGFKSFPNKSLATFAHTVQSKLSTDNLAPMVYSSVCRIRIPNYFIGPNHTIKTEMVLSDWGYLTEIAKPYVCHDDNCDGDCAAGGCENYEEISNLLDAMKDRGIEYIDYHYSNLGYITRPNGMFIVAIDFGRESIGTADEDQYPKVCWEGAEDIECCCDNCRSKYDYA